MYDVIIIGAGIGGVTAAALLAHSGQHVLLLEGHLGPGGCTSSFQRKRPDGSSYVFDVGATLFGGFQPGGAHDWVAQRLGIRFPVVRLEPAMQVWLPDRVITRTGNPQRWRAERQAAFPEQAAQAERFWQHQERLADISWRFATHFPPIPPETPGDLLRLIPALRPELLTLLPHLPRTVAHELRRYSLTDQALRTFIDAQLLISAQVTADACAWPFGSVALDLARQGVFYAEGGAWTIARTLADACIRDGGEVHYHTWVTRILLEHGCAAGVQTQTGEIYRARHVIANLTIWDVQRLLDTATPAALERATQRIPDTWGAFVLYLGVDAAAIPPDLCAHHQIVYDYAAPLGEGNSVFLSLHPAFDTSRAPPNQRALTISTHTRPEQWWIARSAGRAAYTEHKEQLTRQMLQAVERVLPNIRQHIRYQQSGSPVTFQRYTRRERGMVGGPGQRPQQSGFASLGIRAAHVPGLWLVGDSTFPGQSSAAVTQSGIHVWRTVCGELRFDAARQRKRAAKVLQN